MAVKTRQFLGLNAGGHCLFGEAVACVRRGVVGRDSVTRCSSRLLSLVLVHQRPLILRCLEGPLLTLGGVELLCLGVVGVEARTILHRAQAAGV